MRSAVRNSDQQIADTVPTAVLGSNRSGQLAGFYREMRVRAADWLSIERILRSPKWRIRLSKKSITTHLDWTPMSNNSTNFGDVVKATRRDLDEILGWLEREYAEDGGEGFWANRHLIENAQIQHDDLWVVREGERAVAFQVGNYSPEIVSVRKELRHLGLGQKLFSASLRRSIDDNVNVLRVECAPSTSLGFWQKMGFEQYHDRYRPSSLLARMILDREFELPEGLPSSEVRVSFFPEAAGYGYQDKQIPPIVEWTVAGSATPQKTILLERRVLCLSDSEPSGKDLVVRIEIDGAELCFCKAKYEEAEACGVLRDRHGGCFYIDEVKLPLGLKAKFSF